MPPYGHREGHASSRQCHRFTQHSAMNGTKSATKRFQLPFAEIRFRQNRAIAAEANSISTLEVARRAWLHALYERARSYKVEPVGFIDYPPVPDAPAKFPGSTHPQCDPMKTDRCVLH